MYISPEQMNKTLEQQVHQEHQWKQNSSMKGWETTPPGLTQTKQTQTEGLPQHSNAQQTCRFIQAVPIKQMLHRDGIFDWIRSQLKNFFAAGESLLRQL